MPNVSPPPISDDEVGHAAHCRVVLGDRIGDAAADAERRQRDDEGVRQASEHVHRAVHESDRKAGRQHRGDDDRRGIRDLEQQPANDGREGKIGADRKIDAAGEDDEMLAERDDRDDRRLREDVADIRRLQKHRRRDADDHDQDHKDKNWTRAQAGAGRAKSGMRPLRARLSGRATPSPAVPPPIFPVSCFLLIKTNPVRVVKLFFMD